MREHIANIQWETELAQDMDVDSCWNVIKNHLHRIRDKFIPKKKFSKSTKPKRNFKAPDSLLQSFKDKRESFKFYKKYPSKTNFNSYCQARNKVTSEVRKIKQDKEKELANKIKSNPKAFYQYVSSKIKTKDGIADLIKEDGSLTIDDSEKSETLNKFFSSVFTNESTENSPKLDAKTTETISHVEVSVSDMEDALNNLKTCKSPGPDEIHPLILKELSAQLSRPLKILFDKTLEHGIIPSDWKLAEVRPIFKKGKKDNPGNYRPVSLTSIICKIFEGFIKNALCKHLTENNLLSDHQFGFCSGRSCTTQLLVTLDSWMNSLDKNTPVDAVYLDFKKAFDTVPHNRLLTKLESYGVTGKVLEWVKTFLSDRKQYVKVNNASSNCLPVTSGVPQGSVLGPTLFIYFINDLPDITQVPMKIFADDTKVFTEIHSENDKTKLQNAIDDMYNWTDDWLLRFNDSKCKIMHLGKNNPRYQYYIGNEPNRTLLDTTDCEKDLGVHIDPLLTFDNHVTVTSKKASRVAHMIYKTIDLKSKEIMVPLFKALVRPILEYGNPVWTNGLRKNIDAIEKIQRTFTRYISGTEGMSYPERLQYLNLPSLEFRRLRGDLIEVYKITHKIYDAKTTLELFSCSIDKTDSEAPYNLRKHNYNISKDSFKLDKYKYFFTNRVVNTWNNLTTDIVNADTTNSFKNKIDNYFKDIVFTIQISK